MAAVSIGDQAWYKNSKEQNPEGLAAWLLDALRKGGRLIQNDPTQAANGSVPQYATYAQIFADLQATAPNVAAMLPTPQAVQADPVNYAGVQGGDVFKGDEVGAATPVPAPTQAAPSTPAPDPVAEAAAQQRQQVFTNLGSILDSVGMGELFNYQGGQPSGWLWEQIKAGTVQDTPSLNVALESTPVWHRLFGDVIERQRAAAKTNPTDIHIMSPLEIVQYRQMANQLAHQFNAPPSFYNDLHAWDNQMIGQVDGTELKERFVKGWNDVANADPTVRAAFNAYHGATGDQQLWSFFMDPAHSLDNLEMAAQSAVIGGAGTRYGFGLDRPMAERIARLGVGQAQAEQNFGQLQQQQAYFRPDIHEKGDLSQEAVGNQFGIGTPESTLDLERRRIERMSTTQAGSGGAIETRTGVVGVGANR